MDEEDGRCPKCDGKCVCDLCNKGRVGKAEKDSSKAPPTLRRGSLDLSKPSTPQKLSVNTSEKKIVPQAVKSGSKLILTLPSPSPSSSPSPSPSSSNSHQLSPICTPSPRKNSGEQPYCHLCNAIMSTRTLVSSAVCSRCSYIFCRRCLSRDYPNELNVINPICLSCRGLCECRKCSAVVVRKRKDATESRTKPCIVYNSGELPTPRPPHLHLSLQKHLHESGNEIASPTAGEKEKSMKRLSISFGGEREDSTPAKKRRLDSRDKTPDTHTKPLSTTPFSPSGSQERKQLLSSSGRDVLASPVGDLRQSSDAVLFYGELRKCTVNNSKLSSSSGLRSSSSGRSTPSTPATKKKSKSQPVGRESISDSRLVFALLDAIDIDVNSVSRQACRQEAVRKHLQKLLNCLLLAIWRGIVTNICAVPFLQPVVEHEAPDYYSIITSPMDLSAIRRKIMSNEYINHYEFVNDVTLLRDNCVEYCTPRFPHIVPQVEEVKRCCDEHVGALLPALRKVDVLLGWACDDDAS